ncbi:MAG: type II toxin-antitoxin system Phd/YefM family antitoxin [Candidatus Levyibacteriota bacterium]
MNTSVVDKTVPAFAARRQFGELLHNVEIRGDRFVVERHGEPVAALVPIEVYKQWQRGRAAFFAKIRQTAEQANVPEDEAYELAAKAVREVRSRHK